MTATYAVGALLFWSYLWIGAGMGAPLWILLVWAAKALLVAWSVT